MNVGFFVTPSRGQSGISLFGEQAAGRLLSAVEQPDAACAILGRLLYRNELRDRLGGCSDRGPEMSDAALALTAYQRFGADGLSLLEGSYAVVVWDRTENLLIAQRDPLGGYPLFWATKGDQFACSNSLTAVRERCGATSLDSEYLAAYLMLPCFGRNEPHIERTAWCGVQRVLPEQRICWSEHNRRLRTTRYWDWVEQAEVPQSDHLEPLAERFHELLQSAVRTSFDGPTATHLSGGMDSTAITCLCHRELTTGGTSHPLHSISLTYSEMNVLARERPVIESLWRGHPQLIPHAIEADHFLNFDAYVSPPLHEEPWPWLSTVELEAARVNLAHRLGCTTILTGQGADELLDTGPHHIADDLRRGRLISAWQEARYAASAENCSLWSILGPFGLQPLVPARFQDGIGPAIRRGGADWLNMGEATVPPWIGERFARQNQLWERALGHLPQPHGSRPAVLNVALNSVRGRTGDLGRWYLCAPKGIALIHPFLDARVIRFCLGMHARIRPWPRETPKPILAEAMRGVLPEFVRTRPKAGFFNEPYFRGIAQHLPVLEGLVQRVTARHDLDWLNPAALLECLRMSALGIGNRRIQLDRINLTLSYLKWLDQPPTQSPLWQPSSPTNDQPATLLERCRNERMHDIVC